MSHVTCPKCGGTEHTQGYGLACGPMGAYTFCDGCDALLEFAPDLDGMPEDRAKEIMASVDAALKETWGPTQSDAATEQNNG